jgi:glycosyltransferase involved in cell wall biosynthesis
MGRTLWLFYPDYRLSDPYQSLLAAALAPAAEARPGFVADALDACVGRDVVFHIHWEDGVFAGAASQGEARERAADFLHQVAMLRVYGGKVVWTRHNAAPHEDRFPGASRELRCALAAEADLLHVHNRAAAALTLEEGGTEDRLLVLRNPDIGPGYPDDIDDAAGRRYFGFAEDETVFVFLGAMRGYKGIETLLRAFPAVHAAEPRAQLLLGGRQANAREGRFLHTGPGTRLIPHFVDDAVVQYAMHAADFVVAPYHRTLTSGAVALALGFGRPVIVPDLPPLLETVRPGREALFYRRGDEPDLTRTMLAACGLPAATRCAMRAAALRTARAVPFAALAETLLARVDALPGVMAG